MLENVHGFTALKGERWRIEANWPPTGTAWTVFVFHAIFISYLIVASFIDLDHREIPLSITLPGTVIGMIGAVLLAWPWPNPIAVAAVLPTTPWWHLPPGSIVEGLYPWPFWGPLPAWFAPGGNWQMGLATGLAGVLAGTLMLRAIRFLFGLGLGIEALGLGDADLMMMAGSFLGWQPVVVGFFIGVFAGLLFGILQWVVRGENMLPFGPGLAIGVVVSFLCWRWIGPNLQQAFFNPYIILAVGGLGCFLLLAASYCLRVLRLLRQK